MLKVAIIPAYEPPDGFIEYARTLSDTVDHLLVVDDGSGERYAPIFDWKTGHELGESTASENCLLP